VTNFILLSLPIFAAVGLGWVAVKMRLMPLGGTEALGAFSFRFALPALVFRLIAGGPIGQSFNPRFFAGYLASGILIFALVVCGSRLLQRQGAAAASARATTATVSNLGFLGPPIILTFFGDRGAGPLAMAIVCEVMVLMSVGAVIMASADEASSVSSLILRSVVYNPVIIAILAGGAVAASGVPLPATLGSFLSFLGASAAPTALFAVGGALARLRIDCTTVYTAATISLVKLVIYPLTVWYVLAYALRLEPFWIGAGVLIASLPSAGSNYALAQHYGVDTDRVSAAIAVSTIISVVSVPFVGWLMVRS
jgi:malonate transporter and related proteins